MNNIKRINADSVECHFVASQGFGRFHGAAYAPGCYRASSTLHLFYSDIGLSVVLLTFKNDMIILMRTPLQTELRIRI